MIDSFVVASIHQGTHNPNLPIKVPLRFLLNWERLCLVELTIYAGRSSVKRILEAFSASIRSSPLSPGLPLEIYITSPCKPKRNHSLTQLLVVGDPN